MKDLQKRTQLSNLKNKYRKQQQKRPSPILNLIFLLLAQKYCTHFWSIDYELISTCKKV